ncbi:MAG: YihY/virulence factor BrkB family protein [Beijerinckiaceae bacterium]|nr:YihY/virulence factor BrkB family protein [Beijerinckiaceae bacterium]
MAPQSNQTHPPGGVADRDGEAADTPAQIPARGWKEIAARVWTQIGEDRVIAVAAGVTFYSLLAIFPMITALVSIYGFVADPVTINQHLGAMASVLPGGAIEVVGEQVTRIASQPRGQLGFGFIGGLAVTLWSANAGMKAVFDALNVAYGEQEKRSFIWLNLQSMAFTLLAIVGAVLAMLTVVALPPALALLAPGDAMQTIVSIARWPFLVVGLMAALAVLYRYGPSREEPQWKWLSPGAIVAAIVWLVASLAFSFYAQNFGSYNETYGSLGAVIGFMTWIWISVAIVLVGAEINAETERQTEADTTKGPEKPIGKRGAAVADSPQPT